MIDSPHEQIDLMFLSTVLFVLKRLIQCLQVVKYQVIDLIILCKYREESLLCKQSQKRFLLKISEISLCKVLITLHGDS